MRYVYVRTERRRGKAVHIYRGVQSGQEIGLPFKTDSVRSRVIASR